VNLLNYIVRRLLLMILVLFGVSLIVFSIMMIIPPGQRVAIYVKSEKVTPAQMEALMDKYGMNDPAPVQYARWVNNILHGEFGYSETAKGPVIQGFKQYFPITLELVLLSTPLIILVGVWLGTIGAVHKDKPVDHITRVIAIIGYSLPTFWLGLILLMIFYGLLGIFPPGQISNIGKDVINTPEWNRFSGMLVLDGILNGRLDISWDGLYHMILPALNLVLLSSALIMRLMRSSMLDALGQDYIRTALAKGADKKTIYKVHARRNALIPVITISGLMFAGLMGGMVITETIFNRKGIGLWMARAALQLDVPAIMFNVLFLGTIFAIVNLIVDVLYAYIDPRIRLT
jgi:peptide/nickel transport system permease protein